MSTVSNELNVSINGEDTLSPVLAKLEDGLLHFAGRVTSAIATIKLLSFPISAAGDFEREMANVAKTTQYTQSQIKELGTSSRSFRCVPTYPRSTLQRSLPSPVAMVSARKA